MKTFKLLSPRILAASTLLMATLLYAASVFNPALQPLGSLAPIELSTTDLTYGATGYRTWFENGSWQGDLAEYNVSPTGALTSSVIFTSASPVTSGTNWSANVEFNKHKTDLVYYDTGRKIITNSGTSQIAFRWANLTAQQKTDLDSGAPAAGPSTLLDYVRGQRTHESSQSGGTLRTRYCILGDIVHSTPVYVGAPHANHVMNGYAAWATANANRSPRVYVGANDGMLHVFDAAPGTTTTGGQEVYAYIPSQLIGDLDTTAATVFQHKYFVDGGITVADAYVGGGWKSILVSGLGAGGKGFFALDVTNPKLTTEASGTGTDKKVMWEKDATADNDLGYVFGEPTIAKFNDGNWYVALGNGYSSVNGIAKLYLVNLATGAITTLSTSSGSAAAPNGLSAPSLVDTNYDDVVDYAYAGDIDGNIWKFDVSSTSAGSWGMKYKLFSAGGTKPITTKVDVAKNPAGGYIVYAATGRMLTTADATDNTNIQSIFGVYDNGSAPGAQPIRTQTLSGNINFTGTPVETVRTLSNFAMGSNTVWQINLPSGERVLTDPRVRAGRLIMTVTNPLNNENWLAEAAYLNGGAVTGSIFDLNHDVKLDALDHVDGNADGDKVDPEDIPMFWERSSGIMSQPTIARIANGVDTLFLNYLVPAQPTVIEPCVGNCTGGFIGGHIDVDTDAPCKQVPTSGCDNTNQESYTNQLGGNGFSGATTEHVHEYSVATNRAYVDFQEIENNVPATFSGGSAEKKEIKLSEAIDTGLTNAASTTKFIVIVANADLSAGATLQIKDRKWNTAAYQKMIQKKLRNWNGTSTACLAVAPANGLNDGLCDDGFPAVAATPTTPAVAAKPRASLIYSRADLNGIILGASAQTIQQSFNGDAIINGGLFPDIPACVMNDLEVTNSRYRNGALTTQMVAVTVFSTYAGTAGTVGKDFADGSVAGKPAGTYIGAGTGQQRQMLSLLNVQNPLSLANATGLKGVPTPPTTPALVNAILMQDGTQVKMAEDLNGDGAIKATAPDYEVFGGLYVKPSAAGSAVQGYLASQGDTATYSSTASTINSVIPGTATANGMLYEAALFWHYGKEGSTADPSIVCYGSALNGGYDFQRGRFVGTLSQAEYNTILADLGLTQAQVDANAAAGCTTGTTAQKNACKAARTQAQQLQDMQTKIDVTALGTPGISNPPPEVIASGASNSGISLGPNITSGSRTWTDITPK